MRLVLNLGRWICCCRGDEEVAMPEYEGRSRPPKKSLSHITEERSSQMVGSSVGQNSQDPNRRSNSLGQDRSSNNTRRSSTEHRHSSSFEKTRQTHKNQINSVIGNLPAYIDKENEGSQYDNLEPLPTQKQMNRRRRDHSSEELVRKVSVDSEILRSNRSMCTMEQLDERRRSEEEDDEEYSLERMRDYLTAQLAASPPPRGTAPAAPRVDITSSSQFRF